MVSLNRPPSPEPFESPTSSSSSYAHHGIVIQRPTPSSSPSPSFYRQPLPEVNPPLSPIPYVERSPSPGLLPDDDEPAFDSDVLVRTAQASRLRRRGAIRIENRQRADLASSEPPSPPPHASRRRPVPLDEEDEEDDEEDEEGRRIVRPTLPFMLTRSVVPADFSGQPFRLYCGGVPKRLPTRWRKDDAVVWPPPIPSLDAKPAPRSRAPPPSTGCGVLVCVQACASDRIGVWLSDTPKLPKTVTRMDEEYVDRGPANIIKIGTSNCGCEHEGIGCRNCGNSLGMKILHCHRHSDLHASLAQVSSRTSAPVRRKVAYVFNPLAVSHDSDRPAPFPYALPDQPRRNLDLMALPPDLLQMSAEEVAPNGYRYMDNRQGENSTPTTPTAPMATRRSARHPLLERSMPTLVTADFDMDGVETPELPPIRPGWSVIRSPVTPPLPSSDPPRIISVVRSMPSSSSLGANSPTTPTDDRRRSRNMEAWGPPGLESSSLPRHGSAVPPQCPTPPAQLSPNPPADEGEPSSSSSSSSSQPGPSIPRPASFSDTTPTPAQVDEPPVVLSPPVVDALARLEAIRSRLNALLNDS